MYSMRVKHRLGVLYALDLELNSISIIFPQWVGREGTDGRSQHRELLVWASIICHMLVYMYYEIHTLFFCLNSHVHYTYLPPTPNLAAFLTASMTGLLIRRDRSNEIAS